MNKPSTPVALVTGAARRIGACIAQHLHEAGFNVVIHYHKSLKEAHDLAQILNEKRPESAYIVSQDLCTEYAASNLIEMTMDWSGRLDVLINNASIFMKTPENSDANWNILFDTNVKAPFLLSQAARPHLAKEQGIIINIADIHGLSPLKGYAVYSQTKAALIMQTKALAVEFAPLVRVNAIAPGAIMWPEKENALSRDLQQEIIEKTLLLRHGDPKFIATAVLSLVNNTFVTGQVWAIDGGRSI